LDIRGNWHNLTWEPAPPDVALLYAWSGGEERCRDVVMHHRHRTRYALRRKPDNAVEAYLEHDHPQGWCRQLAGRFGVPPVQRFRLACASHAAGLPTPQPLACGRAGAETIALYAVPPDPVRGDVAWRRVRDVPAARQALLDALEAFASQPQVADRFHSVQLCHLLVGGSAEAPSVQFATGWSLMPRWGLPLADLRLQVARHEAPWLNPLVSGLLQYDREMVDRASLGNGEWAWHMRTEDGRWHLRQGIDPLLPEAAVRMHRNLVRNAPDELVKNDRKRRVSKVAVAGTYYAVKEFTAPGPWGPFAPDRRSYVANWRLELSGFDVPRYLGWLRHREGQGYLVMEWIDGTLLGKALEAAPPEGRAALAQATLALFQALYARDIAHQDMKAQNIIVEAKAGAPRLWLIDNDAVRFGQRITQAHWRRNVRQLRETMPQDAALLQALDAVFAPFMG